MESIRRSIDISSRSQPSFLSPRIFRSVHRAIALLLVFFSVCCLSGLSFLSFDDDLKALFRGESQAFQDFEKYGQLFEKNDDDFVILLYHPEVLSNRSLQKLRIVDQQLHQLDSLLEIDSICHLLSMKRVGRMPLPIMPFEGAGQSAWNRARQQFRSHPLGMGMTYSADEHYTRIRFRLDDKVVNDLRFVIGQVEQVLNEEWGEPFPEKRKWNSDQPYFGITGLPLLQSEVTRCLQRDQIKFTWIGLVFALVIGWGLFRKPMPVLVVAAVPFLGLGCILGILGWLGIPLNIVNNVITPLVLVIGFAEVIHILFLTGGLIGEGYSYSDAVQLMIRRLLLPCLLAALTTAIGFGSLLLSTDQSLREFGIIASFASLVMFGIVMSTSTAILSTPLANYCVRSPSKNQQVQPRVRTRPITTSALLTIVMVAVILLGTSTHLALKNYPDYRFTENLPESNLVVRTLRLVDQSFGGSSQDQIVVTFQSRPTPSQLVQFLDQIQRQAEEIGDKHVISAGAEAKPIMGRTRSFSDLLRSLPPPNGTVQQRFRELKNLPRKFWAAFLKLNPTTASIYLSVSDVGSARLNPFLDEIASALQELEQERKELSVVVTGLNVLAVKRSQKMIGDLSYSLAGASVAIFALILVVYRSVSFAVASIIVNAIPILGVAAVMSWVGQPIQYTGIMLLCVCLGLAVDDTVHFLSKLSLELRKQQVDDFDRATLATIGRLWPVFVTTSLMLGVGFGLAATSEIPTFQTFGGFACLALLLALVADLLVLPALLMLFQRIPILKHRTKAS